MVLCLTNPSLSAVGAHVQNGQYFQFSLVTVSLIMSVNFMGNLLSKKDEMLWFLTERLCLRLDLCQCDLEAFNHALHVQDERVLIGVVLNNVVIHVYQDTGEKGRNQCFYIPGH